MPLAVMPSVAAPDDGGDFDNGLDPKSSEDFTPDKSVVNPRVEGAANDYTVDGIKK